MIYSDIALATLSDELATLTIEKLINERKVQIKATWFKASRFYLDCSARFNLLPLELKFPDTQRKTPTLSLSDDCI